MSDLTIVRLLDVNGEELRLTVLQPHKEGERYRVYPITDAALFQLAREVLDAAAKRMNRSQPHPSDSDQAVVVRG